MMNDEKESYMGHLSCKSHTARTEKDLYRICPSKLSKRELEDLYFALLEQNVQLKKTINEQRDQIKMLNTRVQRMTVQKPMSVFHNKDCCAGSKAIINEQKESIADLKKANERLSERLRVLNMRLCSAKQFLRRSPAQGASHCTKCLVSSDSIKNSSMSALNTKRSDTKLVLESSPYHNKKDEIKIQAAEIIVPTIAEIVLPTQSAEVTSSRTDIPVREAPCQRNECKAEIDELKLKIIALEEEVCDVRQSHSQRMRVLEAAQAQYGARQQTEELSTRLQQQHARISDLRSCRRDEDATEACTTNRTLPLAEVVVSEPPVPGRSEWENSPPIVIPDNSGISIFIEEKGHKDSDDSRFTDCKKHDSRQEKERILQERGELIKNEIANIQSQLLNLKVNAASEAEPPGATLEAESSLSHNIFSTSRLKTLPVFDKVPSTSHEPDVLVSTDRINDELLHKSDKTQKYGPEFKYNRPTHSSLNMPRLSLGNNGTDIKIEENEDKNKHSEDDKSSKGNIKTNSDYVILKIREPVDEDKNTIIVSLDKSNQIIQEIIEEEKTNDTLKKNRRSSLKSPFEGKHYRDVGVRYGETRSYESSAKSETNAKSLSQGTEIDKVYIEPDDHESDPSVLYKINDKTSMRRIRYTSDLQTDPYAASEVKPPGINPAGSDSRGDGAHRLADVAIQCLRDDTLDSSCGPEQTSSYLTNEALVKGSIASVDPRGPVLCGGLSRVCDCTVDFAPGPVSLRTCSGAPAALPARGECYRACACGHDPLPPLSSPEPTGTAMEPCRYPLEPPGAATERRDTSPGLRRSSTKPRPSSSERLDHEVSLTDPTPTHDTRPSDFMSPGEDKATSTISDSYETTDGGSLSEGEVPIAGGKRLSTTVDNVTEPERSLRSEKMEDALRAISEELTRCRELLQRRGEKSRRKVSPRSSSSPCAPALALRRAEGACRMRESYIPKCIFTLHVGTVVLADQAAEASRGRSLQASWRLYRQDPSTTRALRGRVFNYDCTMHYDLKVTDHFLYYLKQEELPIVIADVNKQEEVFATCALPLRDVLLHPNRRVDMSLALVPCGGGEEAGVLDVWCSLRVDTAALPAINTAIVRPSSLKSQHNLSSMLEQILDDDHSADYRFSRDLHLKRSKGASEDNQSRHSDSLGKGAELRRSYNDVIENEVPANIRSVNDFKQAVAKKSNDATSIYEMLKNRKWNRRSTLGSQKPQEGGRHKSVTICNQKSTNSLDRGIISQTTSSLSAEENFQSLDITILWLALNEDSRAMLDPLVKRLYVAYSFLGRSGADLETPISLPKPKHYMDKCHFLYKKTFLVSDSQMLTLGRLAGCMAAAPVPDPSRAIVFSVVSEPADDPLELYSCEDIGYANLYLGEVLLRSTGPSYTAVLDVKEESGISCGTLAVRLDGLALLRRCRERVGPPVSMKGGRLEGLGLLQRCKMRVGPPVSMKARRLEGLGLLQRCKMRVGPPVSMEGRLLECLALLQRCKMRVGPPVSMEGRLLECLALLQRCKMRVGPPVSMEGRRLEGLALLQRCKMRVGPPVSMEGRRLEGLVLLRR